MKVNVAGVLIDNLSKEAVIREIYNFVRSDKNVYIVTPYSELVVFALDDPDYKQVLNNAAIALPDGIGILWAAKFLSLPTIKYKLLTYIQALWQIIYTGAAIVLKPDYVRTIIKEQITGSKLIYDLAKSATDNNYSVSLVGGQGNVATQAASRLKKLFPNLNIKLVISGRLFDEKIVEEIARSNSDILLIAYSPPKQEFWIAQNLQNLNCRVVIGLGGTFDYLAGKRLVPPKFMHLIGLEWLWRLITQPWRIIRIWNAVLVFIWKIYQYKRKHGSSRS
ncbi:MAG: hypothetical protein A3B10_01985 [Candidatus Doudnabacteria bacterium RIFCSPLOWO2_01_FULL_44_21]|uniref:Glycosyl transferase n=1 Tax=Candidatus Doudnabacteria bacterium RIFCSPLOWO2_01_FULL_44_21 TaxID=1817841 RepID=A0A1F5Q555_9BACT|nr:MAG: hypothetical protein A3B95_00095 [Candidatus Doudnabacteria bacterium RIFCSPHIGHO2_02_FULL_43_13b]OGE97345.1 MAG: hypothetical protein A3B10_01985 [Candidatus Doudnabacteria bacterium RIFCSPLOWO2_01_FULL_44_21]